MITYEEYMNTVLYDSTCGYYMKHTQKIGREGDFITSSNISNVFGMLFAHVLMNTCKKNELPFIICEIGGGNGRFAKAILDEWEKLDQQSFSALTYIIIETSPYHRQLQQEILPIGKQVVQYESIEEVIERFPNFEGIMISNELFDAFPVRVVEKRDGQLYEVMVSMDEDHNLCERLCVTEDQELSIYLQEQKLVLADNQRFEVPLSMINYLNDMSTLIRRGVVFTVDYGYTNDEWMLPQYRRGSLRGYSNHKLIDNPLLHPGEMDLTTHISFDAVQFYGDKYGLKFDKKLRQDEFLLAAGILDFLQEHHDTNPFSEKSKQNRAIRSLIMGGGISEAFHVLIQKKGNTNMIDFSAK
ncbi:SAM-dependent methyltransferase, MidA family [Litchfieldia salsa]|uniref:SAM-dependent methyltransferase, MidA family n=2 Tax=Litchfieldia salsa TaxID=930152 RepID=A0A1H0VCU0_9BACI|nr:SAM-dependent methyltransferase, MidA family [Litchfieldia salsa]